MGSPMRGAERRSNCDHLFGGYPAIYLALSVKEFGYRADLATCSVAILNRETAATCAAVLDSAVVAASTADGNARSSAVAWAARSNQSPSDATACTSTSPASGPPGASETAPGNRSKLVRS